MDKSIDKVIYSRYRILADGSLKIVLPDKWFEKLTGYNQDDVKKGLSQKDIMFEEDWDEYYYMLTKTLFVEDEGYLEHRLKKKNGEEIAVFCFGVMSDDKTYIDVLITDITATRALKNEVKKVKAEYNKNKIQLEQKNILLENLLNNFTGGMGLFYVEDGKVKAKYLSDSFFKLIGKSRNELAQFKDDYSYLAYKEDRQKLTEFVTKCIGTKGNYCKEFRFNRLDGGIRWLEIHYSYFEEIQNVPMVMAIFFDITQKKETELELEFRSERIKMIAEGMQEVLFDYDVETDIFKSNYIPDKNTKTELEIKDFKKNFRQFVFIYAEDRGYVEQEFLKSLEKETNTSVECRLINYKNNITPKWYRIYFISKADSTGRVKKLAGRLTCINEEKLKNKELIEKAKRDALTGILNHISFENLIKKTIKESIAGRCAFIMADLDNFKNVNDTYGHFEGDNLLKKFAEILTEICCDNGVCGRMGGDEFGVFLYDVYHTDDVKKIAETICKRVAEIEINGEKGKFTSSVGVTIKDYDKAVFKELYIEADHALYMVKRSGRNSFLLYGNELEEMFNNTNNDSINSYIDEEGYILDDMEDMVYISEINTYQLLYINNAVRRRFNLKNDFDISKVKCYELFQNRTSPCEHCTKNILNNKDKTYVWERSNNILGKEYILKDKLIRWKNLRARLEIALDISDNKSIRDALNSRVEFEDAIYRAVYQILNNASTSTNMDSVLSVIGDYYKAEKVSVLMTNYDKDKNGDLDIKNSYDWYSFGYDSMKNIIKENSFKLDLNILSVFMNDKNVIIVDDTEKIKAINQTYYRFLQQLKIRSICAVPIIKNKNSIIGYLVVFNSIKNRAEMTLLNMVSAFLSAELDRERGWKKQEFQMKHDKMTGALNRIAYIEEVESLSNTDNLKSLGLVVADINSLKQINKDFGLKFGNRVVCEILDIFTEIFGQDCVFRVESDDFAIICKNITRDEFLNKLSLLKESLSYHFSGASLGYAWDDFDINFTRMNDHADKMMKSEKAEYYEKKDKKNFIIQDMVTKDVELKLSQDNFKVFLQPKINIETGKYYGAEALIRLINPENNTIIPPINFIPVFEKNGTISKIDFFVAETICKLIKKWEKEKTPIIPISINISRQTLLENSFVEKINAITEKYGIDKKYLELEITETIGDMEYELISTLARKLHEKGFKLSMDDFGTKYSSISMISLMKFDSLKLDRSMINNLVCSETSKKVAKHVIAMCNDIGIECIAEGVEDFEQVEILKEMNCYIVQGYLYGKPIPEKEFEDNYKNSLLKK